MDIYSIGFTHKSAEEFFGTLKRSGVQRLMDIRLNNTSQLAAFAKSADLPYFLRELCGIRYVYEPRLAPTQEIIDSARSRKPDWPAWEKNFLTLMAERDIANKLDRKSFNTPTVLLCSEATAEHCHRRLVLEYLQQHWRGIAIHHL